MKSEIKKGMVLAAGLGTRLQPITQSIPKPLVPVLNIPNILYTLLMLKRTGIREIILNLHHLPDSLQSYLGDGSRWGLELSYSHESTLLGTGGGVKKVEAFFQGGTFVLANCDFITDVDLSPFIERHFSRKSLATMVLFTDPHRQKHYSKVGTTTSGNLCSLPKLHLSEPARSGIFTGIHILSSSTLSHLKLEPCGINDLLYPALIRRDPSRVFGDFMTAGYWLDTGEPTEIWGASMKLLDQLREGNALVQSLLKEVAHYEEKMPGVWAPGEARLPSSGIMAPAVIGNNVRLGKNSLVGPYTVLGDDSVVEDGTKVSRFVGFGAPRIVSKSASETIEGAMQFQDTVIPLKNPA